MKVLIVDDNQVARITIRALLSQMTDIVIAGECETAVEAYEVVQKGTIDLILLDIEMPGMTGIEFIRNIPKDLRPLIIFITSKKDYALDAFDLNVLDYVVKPLVIARFKQAVEKAKETLALKKEEIKSDEEQFIFVRDSNIIRRLKFEELLFAEAMGDYVKLYTPQKFFAIHSTLKAVEERLPAQFFCRVHRSYIVAIDKIEMIREGAIVINKKMIPVADSYRAAFNKRINVL
jgi:DNA-binding LytR/AlgR family response regulator